MTDFANLENEDMHLMYDAANGNAVEALSFSQKFSKQGTLVLYTIKKQNVELH